MAAKTVSIASDSTHLEINSTIAAMLASHGEVALLASVAQAIGFQRMKEVADEKPAFRCDDPNDTGPHDTVTYYVAGCEGAKALARQLGRTIFKAGYTEQKVKSKRLIGLNQVVYGGWSVTDPNLDPMQPSQGWTTWSFARHEPTDTAHVTPPSGITIVKGQWLVQLPEGIDAETFDRYVTAAMMPRQLAFWVLSGVGRAHCKQRGLDPEAFVRLSHDLKTGLLRPAEELYVYNPRKDAAWFATILGEALARVRSGGSSN
jgi:hypothetical protein